MKKLIRQLIRESIRELRAEGFGSGEVPGYQSPTRPGQVATNEGRIQDPDRDEMMEFLKQRYGNEEGFEYDAEEAMYWFANWNHGGQASNLYSVLSTSQFRPGPISKGPEPGSMRDRPANESGQSWIPRSPSAPLTPDA